MKEKVVGYEYNQNSTQAKVLHIRIISNGYAKWIDKRQIDKYKKD